MTLHDFYCYGVMSLNFKNFNAKKEENPNRKGAGLLKCLISGVIIPIQCDNNNSHLNNCVFTLQTKSTWSSWAVPGLYPCLADTCLECLCPI